MFSIHSIGVFVEDDGMSLTPSVLKHLGLQDFKKLLKEIMEQTESTFMQQLAEKNLAYQGVFLAVMLTEIGFIFYVFF